MFCTNCGSQIQDNARFCVACGSPAQAPAPVQQAPVPQVVSAPPPPTVAPPMAPRPSGGTKNCGWCRAVVDDSQESCPQCGATLGAKTIATNSNWVELPGRKDMAKIHFGNSSCQIEGLYVPVADMNLAQTDSIYFSHHVLLWKDVSVNISVMPMKGAWTRMFAGM